MKQRTDVLTSLRDTLSYHGTVTAQLGAYAYMLDDELRLYVSHSNCRPMGRCMAVGARVLVRKAHPIFDSEGNLKALGCCSYGYAYTGIRAFVFCAVSCEALC